MLYLDSEQIYDKFRKFTHEINLMTFLKRSIVLVCSDIQLTSVLYGNEAISSIPKLTVFFVRVSLRPDVKMSVNLTYRQSLSIVRPSKSK